MKYEHMMLFSLVKIWWLMIPFNLITDLKSMRIYFKLHFTAVAGSKENVKLLKKDMRTLMSQKCMQVFIQDNPLNCPVMKKITTP